MIREISPTDKNQFDSLATHPLQSWAWGEFRKMTGVKVLRLGKYVDNKLIETAQITFHPIPHTRYTIGYFAKGSQTSSDMLSAIFNYSKDLGCIFVKFEPNLKASEYKPFNSNHVIVPSSHPLFTRYTFQLRLTPSEDELLKSFHPKTRYNIKLAQKHKVVVSNETETTEAFDRHLDLMFDTAKRQSFFAHDKNYHKTLWELLKNEKIAYLFQAKYKSEEKTYLLASWVLFLFNGVLYYPYGASSTKFRNTMASNLIMWEAIRFGKKNNAKLFDMWGSLGPNPNPNDPWQGFHRFKQGYGADLIEFVGSFDLIISANLYKIYNKLYTIRKTFLALRRKLV